MSFKCSCVCKQRKQELPFLHLDLYLHYLDLQCSIFLEMSSWIKLVDQSSSKTRQRPNRSKRTHPDFVPSIIDDDSSDGNCDLNTSISTKKRKIMPLENLTIDNDMDSSNDCCDVQYNPDGVELPDVGKKKIKTALPIAASIPVTNQPSTSLCANTTRTNTWLTWTSIPQVNDQINLPLEIEDSGSDSNESSSHTLIDESSADGSFAESPIVEEQDTMIETQESITPPVAPFIASTPNLPKKRKVRMKKGGLVERLAKSLSQAKSNVLFWQHHRSADLVPPGVVVTVNRVEDTYGRKLIHTRVNGERTIFSLCSRTVDAREGDTMEVEFDSDHCYNTDTHVRLYSYVDKVIQLKENGSS